MKKKLKKIYKNKNQKTRFKIKEKQLKIDELAKKEEKEDRELLRMLARNEITVTDMEAFQKGRQHNIEKNQNQNPHKLCPFQVK